MHEKPMPQPAVALPADLTLLPLWIPLRNQPLPIVIAQILNDRRTLSNDQRLLSTRRFDSNHRRLSQWVDFLQLGVREFVFAALVCLQLVGDLQFFQ